MSAVQDLLRKSAGQPVTSELGAPVPSFPQADATVTSRADNEGVEFEIPALPDFVFKSAPGVQYCSLIAATAPDLQSGMSTILHVVGSADGETFIVQPGAKRTEIKTLPGQFASAAQLDELDRKIGTLYVFYMLVPQGSVSQAVQLKIDLT